MLLKNLTELDKLQFFTALSFAPNLHLIMLPRNSWDTSEYVLVLEVSHSLGNYTDLVAY